MNSIQFCCNIEHYFMGDLSESDLNGNPQDYKLTFSLHSYRQIELGVCLSLQFLSACWF